MNCDKCETRMKCIDSACCNNITARRYKCPQCNNQLYSMELCKIENIDIKYEVLKQLQNKRYSYYKK